MKSGSRGKGSDGGATALDAVKALVPASARETSVEVADESLEATAAGEDVVDVVDVLDAALATALFSAFFSKREQCEAASAATTRRESRETRCPGAR